MHIAKHNYFLHACHPQSKNDIRNERYQHFLLCKLLESKTLQYFFFKKWARVARPIFVTLGRYLRHTKHKNFLHGTNTETPRLQHPAKVAFLDFFFKKKREMLFLKKSFFKKKTHKSSITKFFIGVRCQNAIVTPMALIRMCALCPR